jgi:hypothetical protein
VLIVWVAAFTRRQELLQPLAVGLLGLLVAMPRVVELEASPLICIHGVRLRSLEFAVRWRLFVDGFMNGFTIWFMERCVRDKGPFGSARLPPRAKMDGRCIVGCRTVLARPFSN